MKKLGIVLMALFIALATTTFVSCGSSSCKFCSDKWCGERECGFTCRQADGKYYCGSKGCGCTVCGNYGY